MRTLTFSLRISKEDYLRHYQGFASQVITQAADGTRIQFPASLLRQHVSHNGVSGYFEIEFDDHFKCVALRRIDV